MYRSRVRSFGLNVPPIIDLLLPLLITPAKWCEILYLLCRRRTIFIVCFGPEVYSFKKHVRIKLLTELIWCESVHTSFKNVNATDDPCWYQLLLLLLSYLISFRFLFRIKDIFLSLRDVHLVRVSADKKLTLKECLPRMNNEKLTGLRGFLCLSDSILNAVKNLPMTDQSQVKIYIYNKNICS